MNNASRLVMVAIAAAVICPPGAHAGFDLGVKAGVNIANASIDTANAPSTDAITGLTAGAFVSLGLGAIEIEPDLLFTAKGYKYGDPAVPNAEFVNKFQYVEVPVLLKWMIIPAGPVKPYLGAGPAIGFLTSADVTSKIAGASTTADAKSALEGSDYSAVIEAGVRVGLGGLSLHGDVRYSIGLADIQKTGSGSLKNNTVSILVGVGF